MSESRLSFAAVATALIAVVAACAPGAWAASSGVCYRGHCILVGKPSGLNDNEINLIHVIEYRKGAWLYNDYEFARFGGSRDHPVVGDWNGDGHLDLGLYNNGQWTLQMLTPDGATQPLVHTVKLGNVAGRGTSRSQPLVGNWAGGPNDSIGVYNEGRFTLLMDLYDPSSTIDIDFGELATNISSVYNPMPFAGPIDQSGTARVGLVSGPTVKYAPVNVAATYNFATSDPWLVSGSVPVREWLDLRPVVVHTDQMLGVDDREGHILAFMLPPNHRNYGDETCIDGYSCPSMPIRPQGGGSSVIPTTDPFN